ncbi:MAG: hypothetical protein HY052_05365 [Proteobacteria bacterium]|nr:hypothetical protein [Pseudomonadota bacterium]
MNTKHLSVLCALLLIFFVVTLARAAEENGAYNAGSAATANRGIGQSAGDEIPPAAEPAQSDDQQPPGQDDDEHDAPKSDEEGD